MTTNDQELGIIRAFRNMGCSDSFIEDVTNHPLMAARMAFAALELVHWPGGDFDNIKVRNAIALHLGYTRDNSFVTACMRDDVLVAKIRKFVSDGGKPRLSVCCLLYSSMRARLIENTAHALRLPVFAVQDVYDQMLAIVRGHIDDLRTQTR